MSLLFSQVGKKQTDQGTDEAVRPGCEGRRGSWQRPASPKRRRLASGPRPAVNLFPNTVVYALWSCSLKSGPPIYSKIHYVECMNWLRGWFNCMAKSPIDYFQTLGEQSRALFTRTARLVALVGGPVVGPWQVKFHQVHRW